MPFTQVLVTAVFTSGGKPIPVGVITITPSREMTDGAGIVATVNETVCTISQGILLGPAGTPGVTLNATDDPTTTPPNVFYTASIEASGHLPYQLYVSVPHADSPQVDLLSLPQVVPPSLDNLQAPGGAGSASLPPTSWVWLTDPLAPAAAAATPGTSQTATPAAGYSGIPLIAYIQAAFSGSFGMSETATVTITATYSDDTASSAETVSSTTATTQQMTPAAVATLHKNGVTMTAIAATVESSIANSGVTATVKAVGLQA